MKSAKSEIIHCRLCGAVAHFNFSRQAEDGDEIACYKCSLCGSLQTEEPYWLASEYSRSAEHDFLNLDTYAVDRCLRSRTAAYFLWKFAGFGKHDQLLDWGGGVGLVVRLLPDVGIDAYLHDKYARNHYASGFTGSERDRYSVVTAFEVFEHFPNPATDLQRIFDLQPSLLVISTGNFTGQGPAWPYLGPAKSEHVFFYSAQALQLIGDRFGYNVMRLRHNITLFYKDSISVLRLNLAALVLSRSYIADVAFALIPKRSYCETDNQSIRAILDAKRLGNY